MSLLATRPPTDTNAPAGGKHRLHEPGGRGGFVEVFRARKVVQMLVRRDLRLRYRTSSIGYLWAFVQPTIQFCVYYFIVGIVFGIERRVENFAIYVFSGLCLVTFYNSTLNGATKSILKNRAIIKKVWLPREIFPVAAMLVASTRFIPQFLILMIGATASGWYFTWEGLLAAISGVAIVLVWAMAVGLVAAAINVYVREISAVLMVVGFLTHWLTPMVKPWTLVQNRVAPLGTTGVVILAMYIYNPLCTALELWHLAFWMPTVQFDFELSPNLWTRAWVFLLIGLVALSLAQRLFRRMQASLVDEL